MKRMSAIKSWLLGMCLTGLFILSGCEPTVISPCQEDTNQRIQLFKDYCYDSSGHVRLEQPEGFADTEWMIPIETDTDVHSLFHRLTGLQVHPAEKYEYSYHSADYRYEVRLMGTEIKFSRNMMKIPQGMDYKQQKGMNHDAKSQK